jgi:hypothetical protein
MAEDSNSVTFEDDPRRLPARGAPALRAQADLPATRHSAALQPSNSGAATEL